MIFVIAVAMALAAVRFGISHWTYTVGALVVGFIGIWLMYRAAVATARAYGLLLVTIAKLDRPKPQPVRVASTPGP